ncbi:hypothetical protein H4W33_001171 [Kibdelosporangium phytohabitans]|nr:hypothetical protein [Kibdelosporangium phytohabitans]
MTWIRCPNWGDSTAMLLHDTLGQDCSRTLCAALLWPTRS